MSLISNIFTSPFLLDSDKELIAPSRDNNLTVCLCYLILYLSQKQAKPKASPKSKPTEFKQLSLFEEI